MMHPLRPSGWLLAGLLGLVVLVAPPAPAQEENPEPATPPTEAPAAATVARAQVCTDVVDREPVNPSTSFGADVGQLYCFTEIRGAEGTTITHAWIHEGTTRARVDLPVRSPRWRTWSSKQILPAWTGNWQVKVLDADGVVLDTLDFVVE